MQGWPIIMSAVRPVARSVARFTESISRSGFRIMIGCPIASKTTFHWRPSALNALFEGEALGDIDELDHDPARPDRIGPDFVGPLDPAVTVRDEVGMPGTPVPRDLPVTLGHPGVPKAREDVVDRSADEMCVLDPEDPIGCRVRAEKDQRE